MTGPLCHVSNHGSSVTLLKFQMAPKLRLLISSCSRKKEPRYAGLSETRASHSQRMWAEFSCLTPHLQAYCMLVDEQLVSLYFWTQFLHEHSNVRVRLWRCENWIAILVLKLGVRQGVHALHSYGARNFGTVVTGAHDVKQRVTFRSR